MTPAYNSFVKKSRCADVFHRAIAFPRVYWPEKFCQVCLIVIERGCALRPFANSGDAVGAIFLATTGGYSFTPGSGIAIANCQSSLTFRATSKIDR